jgi:hypothetical protein
MKADRLDYCTGAGSSPLGEKKDAAALQMENRLTFSSVSSVAFSMRGIECAVETRMYTMSFSPTSVSVTLLLTCVSVSGEEIAVDESVFVMTVFFKLLLFVLTRVHVARPSSEPAMNTSGMLAVSSILFSTLQRPKHNKQVLW